MNPTTNELLTKAMNRLIRSKPYQFMDPKLYLIIFQQLPRAAATSVNDVIAVNIMNRDLRKWTTMAQDMDIIVNHAINLLPRERPNIREDIFEEWLIWTPRLLNRDATITNHSTLWCPKPIQELNERLARRSLFLSQRLNRHTEENINNQEILLPGETIIETVDEKSHGSIEEKNILEGILLPWDLRTTWKKGNNLLFYTVLFRPNVHV